MDNGAFTRRNQAAPCQNLVNGMSMIQLLQMDLLSYSTKPEMRRRVGMDKILIHLPRTPGLRGWNLMLQNQARYVFFSWLCMNSLLWTPPDDELTTLTPISSLKPVIFPLYHWLYILVFAEEMVLLCDSQPYAILRETTACALEILSL